MDVGGVYGVGGAKAVYLGMLFTFHLTSLSQFIFNFVFYNIKIWMYAI